VTPAKLYRLESKRATFLSFQPKLRLHNCGTPPPLFRLKLEIVIGFRQFQPKIWAFAPSNFCISFSYKFPGAFWSKNSILTKFRHFSLLFCDCFFPKGFWALAPAFALFRTQCALFKPGVRAPIQTPSFHSLFSRKFLNNKSREKSEKRRELPR
jgi:hypothetical protein